MVVLKKLSKLNLCSTSVSKSDDDVIGDESQIMTYSSGLSLCSSSVPDDEFSEDKWRVPELLTCLLIIALRIPQRFVKYRPTSKPAPKSSTTTNKQIDKINTLFSKKNCYYSSI